MEKNLSLTIGWLYPDLMSTYGDRGNIMVLQKRAQWQGVEVTVKKISIEQPTEDIVSSNLLFMGGAQDRQQEIVNRDLEQGKGAALKHAIENNIPGLYICGAYQFMGNYYKAADGTKISGFAIFDLYTENPGINSSRLIGNIVMQPSAPELKDCQFVGFENHGGRTYLSDTKYAFGKVIKGFGNNGEDQTEGIKYNNAIGTYLHGPILAKNPELADFLIKKALEVKYKEQIDLEKIEHPLEDKARVLLKERFNK